jgi:hypothetical protein
MMRGASLTQMWILLVLVESKPKERADYTCTLDGPIWKTHNLYHSLIQVLLQAYDSRGKRLGVFCILL